MAVQRKDAQELKHRGPNQVRPENNVDPGISASQAVPVLLDYYSILSMVLGGCCANVWAYEQLLMINPRIGSALTFSQMLFITTQSLLSFLSFGPNHRLPRLKSRQVPLRQWALQVLVLTSGSLLNNWAFAYNVPLTILIVFRSAGLAVSMLLGSIFLKKRYSPLQIFCVALVSAGVVIATVSRPSASSKSHSVLSSESLRQYMMGIGMLVISLFLTGFLGVLQERTYTKYGPCWREGVFYTHFLSLPIFLFLIPDIKQGFWSLSNGNEASARSALVSFLILGGNLISQLICVSGVNQLSSQVSSVSTNLVLTTRKALSLCFSVWWFGSGWNTQLGIGAAMVFVGSLLFTVAGDKKRTKDD